MKTNSEIKLEAKAAMTNRWGQATESCGAHKFYIGKTGQGFLYLLESDEEFYAKHIQ